jgi:hypothetical protein
MTRLLQTHEFNGLIVSSDFVNDRYPELNYSTVTAYGAYLATRGKKPLLPKRFRKI